MSIPNELKIPRTAAMRAEWRRYCLVRALECRRLGSDWVEAKRHALHNAKLERQLIRMFKGDDHVA